MKDAATARRELDAHGLWPVAILCDERDSPAQAALGNFSFLFLLQAGTSITRARKRRSIGMQLRPLNRSQPAGLARTGHSDRRASTGLIEAARLAGSAAANNAMINKADTDMQIETGSALLVSNRRALAK